MEMKKILEVMQMVCKSEHCSHGRERNEMVNEATKRVQTEVKT